MTLEDARTQKLKAIENYHEEIKNELKNILDKLELNGPVWYSQKIGKLVIEYNIKYIYDTPIIKFSPNVGPGVKYGKPQTIKGLYGRETSKETEEILTKLIELKKLKRR